MGRTNESKVFFSRIGFVRSGIGTVYLISMILSGIEHLDLVLFLSLIQYSHQRISGACWALVPEQRGDALKSKYQQQSTQR